MTSLLKQVHKRDLSANQNLKIITYWRARGSYFESYCTRYRDEVTKMSFTMWRML